MSRRKADTYAPLEDKIIVSELTSKMKLSEFLRSDLCPMNPELQFDT